jgi:coenzyme F420-0:L-glutamate ligase / coenzyme F420-1:gamma-L-glutamate ligase
VSVRELRVRPVLGLPEIEPGADLGALIADRGDPRDGEIVVVSQKVVSKAEGRTRRLSEIEPGERAHEVAAATGKDPSLVELILAESGAVIRADPGVLIVETRGGWVCANAGIDASNLPGDDVVSLLPEDPDASARAIRAEIRSGAGTLPAVVIADSFGRAWRLGQTDVAIGCAGLAPLDDWRGRADAHGRELSATVIAIADEVAAAADLIRDKDSGAPAAIVAGLERLVSADDGPGARTIQRPRGEDLFR